MKVNFSVICEGLAESYGNREAIVNVERNRRISFREYHALTNRIANMLGDALGLGVGDRYACLLENDNLCLLHWVTAAKGQATCCHSNYRDSLNTHLEQLKTVKAKVAFVERELLETHHAPLRDLGITIVSMESAGAEYPDVLDFWELVGGANPENPNFVLEDREHIVLMRFTGGTTGDSKCAMYCFDNLAMCRDSWYFLPDGEFCDGCRTLHLAPISHGSGMLVFPTLFQGGCTVTMNHADLAAWCRTIEAERITHAFIVPTLAYRLLELAEASAMDRTLLKTIIYGAAPMSPAKTAQLVERFGPIFVQAYGSTEHFAVTVSLSKKDHTVDAGSEKRLGSAGRRVPGMEVLIADDDGKPVPEGSLGELYLRSRATCLGYAGNAEKTAEEFQDGYWKSGDIGYVDDEGYIFIADRKKDMIITGGFNVYANEVENALSSHPDVLMSAVVGVPHAEWGEAIHAEVILRPEAELDEEGLRSHVKSILGSFKTPKSIVFVKELPLSAAGKVLRKDVRQKYWAKSERKVG